jgi:hypothetical protein
MSQVLVRVRFLPYTTATGCGESKDALSLTEKTHPRSIKVRHRLIDISTPRTAIHLGVAFGDFGCCLPDLIQLEIQQGVPDVVMVGPWPIRIVPVETVD